jgi:hypothetical protein
MATTEDPQKQKNNQENQTKINRSEFKNKTYEDVWQDRRAEKRARIASDKPSRSDKPLRARDLSKNPDRLQKNNSSRKTAQVTTWVEKPISILIDECVIEWGVSRSKATAMLVDLGLENKILSANSRLLANIVQQTVEAECRRFFARLSGILFRIYLIVAQTLHLQRNLVARSGIQKKLTTDQVKQIIDWSKDQARSDVTPKSGGVDQTLDQAVSAWLEQFDEKAPAGERGQSN